TGNARTHLAGIRDNVISLEGMFDGDADSVDRIMEELLGDDTVTAISWGPEGFDAIGDQAKLMGAHKTDYTVSAPLDDVVSLTAEGQGSGSAIIRGFVLRLITDSTAAAATENSTSVDQGESGTDGAVAAVHVEGNTLDAAADVIVQHSPDDSVWADLITVNVAAGQVGGFIGETAEGVTVDQFLRAQVDASGAASGTIEVGVTAGKRT
ncbi:MAG: hypothetical protein R3324_10310, partial [Halobacteriales archaeon]|nr:hypothetical protein [Halobacteriales archaeon]